MSDTTTRGRLYIINTQTLERLEIQYVPKELRTSRTVSAGDVQVISSNLPKYFPSGGDKRLEMELDFYSVVEERTDVKAKVNWLESLTFNNGQGTQNPKIKLVFGDLYDNELWYVLDVKHRYSNFNKVYGFLPQQAYVNITLGFAPDEPVYSRDLR